jgi:hypothetical protein
MGFKLAAVRAQWRPRRCGYPGYVTPFLASASWVLEQSPTLAVGRNTALLSAGDTNTDTLAVGVVHCHQVVTVWWRALPSSLGRGDDPEEGA